MFVCHVIREIEEVIKTLMDCVRLYRLANEVEGKIDLKFKQALTLIASKLSFELDVDYLRFTCIRFFLLEFKRTKHLSIISN